MYLSNYRRNCINAYFSSNNSNRKNSRQVGEFYPPPHIRRFQHLTFALLSPELEFVQNVPLAKTPLHNPASFLYNLLYVVVSTVYGSRCKLAIKNCKWSFFCLISTFPCCSGFCFCLISTFPGCGDIRIFTFLSVNVH